MRTLYEEVINHYPPRADKAQEQLFAKMQEAEIIHIQNVADYYFESIDKWGLKDFPNIAPPFNELWMEFKVPPQIIIDKEVERNPLAGYQFGFLIVSKEVKDMPNVLKRLARVEGKERWTTFVFSYFKVNNIPKRLLNYVIGIDEAGKILCREDGEFAFMTLFSKNQPELMELEENEELPNFLCPALLAISFMHCKNVTLIPGQPKFEKGKKYNRHGPKIKFKVLQIEPMKKILREEGKAEETGLKQALHICRGHFKDFTQGKGLFGKYKDVFWWDSQVRGSGERGVVLKDYNVNEPKGTE